jgi:hypothetical protein
MERAARGAVQKVPRLEAHWHAAFAAKFDQLL